jgi:F0F1-type ATP synthase membrane subunit b/b'
MTTQEIFEKIESLLAEAKVEHSKTTKAAHGRARKSLSEISKLIKEYRKTSINEDKQ